MRWKEGRKEGKRRKMKSEASLRLLWECCAASLGVFFFLCVFLFFMLLSSTSWPFINLASLFITTGDAYFLLSRPARRRLSPQQLNKNHSSSRSSWEQHWKRKKKRRWWPRSTAVIAVALLYRFFFLFPLRFFAWLLPNDYLSASPQKRAKTSDVKRVNSV